MREFSTLDRLRLMLALGLDKLANFGPLAIISVLVLGVVVIWLNPAKIGSYLWVVSKLTLAAVMGEAIFRAMSRDSADPDPLARSMAQTQRATLLAACIVAAGLMP